MGSIRAVHEFDHIVCEVVDGGYAQARGRSAQSAAAGNLLGRKVSAGAAVDGRAVARVRRARGVEFGTRAKTGIGEAGVLQLTQGVLVQIQAIVLVVGAFVPLQSQPGQVVNQLSGKFRALAAIVQVLDAQHDAAALAAGRKPRAQAAEHVAQVHAARGRRGKAAHDGGGRCRCWCVRGVCCYVACVDIHADEYSAGLGREGVAALTSWRRCALRTVGLRLKVSIAAYRLSLTNDRNPGSSSQLPGFPRKRGT